MKQDVVKGCKAFCLSVLNLLLTPLLLCFNALSVSNHGSHVITILAPLLGRTARDSNRATTMYYWSEHILFFIITMPAFIAVSRFLQWRSTSPCQDLISVKPFFKRGYLQCTQNSKHWCHSNKLELWKALSVSLESHILTYHYHADRNDHCDSNQDCTSNWKSKTHIAHNSVLPKVLSSHPKGFLYGVLGASQKWHALLTSAVYQRRNQHNEWGILKSLCEAVLFTLL